MLAWDRGEAGGATLALGEVPPDTLQRSPPRMLTLGLVCAPFLIAWGGSIAFAWCTTRRKRGVLLQRWRDLRRPRSSDGDLIVDLSRVAAARLVALRAGSIVRGVAYLVLIGAVVFEPPQPMVAVLLAIVIYGQWPKAANAVFLRFVNYRSRAYTISASDYVLGRAWVRSVGRGWLAYALPLVGVGLMLVAGLVIARGSDSLISPIPGIYVQHTGLPSWVLSLWYFTAGLAVLSAGRAVERHLRRRTMRRESGLNPNRANRLDWRPPVLLLRPFESDKLTVPAHSGPRDSLFGILVPTRVQFLEDAATWLLWSIGPVVAVADPRGRSTPTLGAAHHRLPGHADWQKAITDLMDRAVAIVLIPGASSGVAWEIDQVLRTPKFATKALLINPDPAHDDRFLAIAGASERQAMSLRGRGLRALAAAPGRREPQLLCATLAEDLDLESAAEWFVRHRTVERTLGQRMWTALRGLQRGRRQAGLRG